MNTGKQYLKWLFRPNLKIEKRFRDGAIAIEKEKYITNLYKPIYIGTCRLDLSKVLTLFIMAFFGLCRRLNLNKISKTKMIYQ